MNNRDSIIAFLADNGWVYRAAAEEFAITVDGVKAAVRRAREAGDPRVPRSGPSSSFTDGKRVENVSVIPNTSWEIWSTRITVAEHCLAHPDADLVDLLEHLGVREVAA